MMVKACRKRGGRGRRRHLNGGGGRLAALGERGYQHLMAMFGVMAAVKMT